MSEGDGGLDLFLGNQTLHEENGEESTLDIIGLWAQGLGNPWVS